MNIIKQLNWRYATKQFDPDKKVSEKDFETILESLRLTPSSFGLQPWKFVVVENQKTRAKLIEKSWGQRQVAEASHLIVLCRPAKFGDKEVDEFIEDTAKTRGVSKDSLEGYSKMMKGFLKKQTPEQKNNWMEKQVYLALGNVMTVCAMMGIDSCPMEGFDATGYNEILGLTEKGLHAVVLCPVGYRVSDDKYAHLKKVRFSTKKVVDRIN